MDNEAATVLKTIQSVLEQASPSYLCETCWMYVADGGFHECNPEERARAMLSVTDPHFHDPRRRAKGYGVR